MKTWFSVVNCHCNEHLWDVALELPVIICSHQYMYEVSAYSPLCSCRETTSGVHSSSSLRHPRSTTGIKSSVALYPNSRWGPIMPIMLLQSKHVRGNTCKFLSTGILVSSLLLFFYAVFFQFCCFWKEFCETLELKWLKFVWIYSLGGSIVLGGQW